MYDILVFDFRRDFCTVLYQICSTKCLPPSTASVAFSQAILVSQTAISGRGAYSVIGEWGEQEGKGTKQILESVCEYTHTYVLPFILAFFLPLEQFLILMTKFGGGLQILCSEK